MGQLLKFEKFLKVYEKFNIEKAKAVALNYSRQGRTPSPVPSQTPAQSSPVNYDKEAPIQSRVVDKGAYDQHNFTGYIVYVPKNYASTDVHVLFCGMHTKPSTGFTSFYTNAVNPLLDRVAVVITHSYHGSDFSKYVGIVQDFLSKNGFNLKINTIAGFSRGGNPVWPHVGPRSNMKFVGLIDPSTTEYDVDLGTNSIMECNPSNWGGSGSDWILYKTLKWYCEHKDDPKYSGKVFCVNKNHSQIMQTFYQKYGNRI